VLVQRITYFPALGKTTEVLALLRERVVTDRAHGRTSTLIAEHLNAARGPSYCVDTELQDLAAYQAFHEERAADEAAQSFEATITSMLAAPPDDRLFRVPIPVPATPAVQAPYYTHSAWFYPQPGLEFVVQQLVDERVRFFIHEGESAAMWSGSYGNGGAVFVLLHHYQRLADFDAFRAEAGPDTVGALFTARLARVVRLPQETRLSETLLQ